MNNETPINSDINVDQDKAQYYKNLMKVIKDSYNKYMIEVAFGDKNITKVFLKMANDIK
jgi:hypothetical protein